MTETETIQVSLEVAITRSGRTGLYRVRCPGIPGIEGTGSTRAFAVAMFTEKIEDCGDVVEHERGSDGARRRQCLEMAEQADNAEGRAAWVALAAELRRGTE
ncbi:MAG: hypothetical protein ACI9MR_000030 [Myxococcota bacterium]|jgi:hypothetical protein